MPPMFADWEHITADLSRADRGGRDVKSTERARHLGHFSPLKPYRGKGQSRHSRRYPASLL
jgi:hypothetical protein